MDTIFSFILLFLLTFTFFLRSLLSKRHKLPPGPHGLPIIGNLHQLGQKPHQTLARLAKIHGPIMSLKLGQVTTIVMSSSETAKQVLQIHDQFLSNRKIPDAMRGASHDQYCLAFLPVSQHWRDLRKICNNLLFSNKTLEGSEELRRKKVLELFNDIHESMLKGEVVDIGRLVFKTTLNLLSNTIYSEDLIHSADKAGELKEVVANIMKEIGRPNLADCFPVLKVVDPHGIRRRTGGYLGKLLNIVKGLVDQRVKVRKQSGYCSKNDMLDAMLDNGDDAEEEMYKDKIERLSLVRFLSFPFFL
ncbi:Cytochrome P450 [Sesbania bispinosa]|nr:Cytochrome P450 [Sesbania bispinosa]